MESAGLDTTLANIVHQLSNLTVVVNSLQDEAAARKASHSRMHYPQTRVDTAQLQEAAAALPLPAASTPPSPAAVSPSRPEPTVPLPRPFNGDRSHYRSFITSCEVLFSLQPRTHPTEFIRVRTVIALLTGEPQAWAHQLLQTNHPALSSWSTFIQAMNEIYDDPLRIPSAHTALRNLRQEHREVEYYISDFRRLSIDSTWNEPALLDQFRQGLSESIKDELVRIDFPTTLTEAMSLCVKIDRRLRERRREKAEGRVKPRRPPPPIPVPIDEPMQVGISRQPLTEAEKARRKTHGLCLYCGQAGHLVNECKV